MLRRFKSKTPNFLLKKIVPFSINSAFLVEKAHQLNKPVALFLRTARITPATSEIERKNSLRLWKFVMNATASQNANEKVFKLISVKLIRQTSRNSSAGPFSTSGQLKLWFIKLFISLFSLNVLSPLSSGQTEKLTKTAVSGNIHKENFCVGDKVKTTKGAVVAWILMPQKSLTLIRSKDDAACETTQQKKDKSRALNLLTSNQFGNSWGFIFVNLSVYPPSFPRAS